jgi:superfamily II DNA or RNA helicase
MLRPYQSSAVWWTLDTWSTLRAAHRRTSVVLQAPTGAGKTVIGAALSPDLWIAPGVDLVRQTKPRVPSARVVTVQELAAMLRRGEELPPAQRVVCDEGRWIAAPGWGRIVEHYLTHGCEVAILDATPATSTGQGLGRWAEELYQVASMRQLIAEGHLCPFRVMAPSEPTRELCATPYQAWALETPGQSTVVFCQDKRHARDTAQDFLDHGISAAVITDETPHRERLRIISGLESGAIMVAVCAQILRQGIDVPRVSSIILARACGSRPLYLQALGRGGRPWEEYIPGGPTWGAIYMWKRYCTVLDLRGAVHLHGVPEADTHWSLEGDAVRVASTLPPCVQCLQCGAWGEGGGCLVCGAALPPPPPPRVRAKDLIEVRAEEDDGQKRATLERYVRDSIAKGHNPLSARYRYKGTYGAFPPGSWLTEAISAHRHDRVARSALVQH